VKDAGRVDQLVPARRKIRREVDEYAVASIGRPRNGLPTDPAEPIEIAGVARLCMPASARSLSTPNARPEETPRAF
jgi:hypothetical protein